MRRKIPGEFSLAPEVGAFDFGREGHNFGET